MIVVNYHDDLNEVQGGAVSASGPFDRIEWWKGLAQHCGMTPFIAQVSDGTAQAILPLLRDENGLSSLCNWYNFTWRPLLSEDGARLLIPLARDLAKFAPRISFARLPDEAGEATLMEAAFNAAGWTTFRSQCDVNHVLHLNSCNYVEYLAGRPGQLRAILRRRANKVSVTVATAFDPEIWAAYEAIYANSWKPHEGSPEFLRAFAEAEGAAGRLRLGLARAEGVPVAAQFWTVENGTAFIHKLAHTEASKPLSPGTTLSAALFEHVIDRDQVTLIDFGTGDDGYKRDWMEEVRPRYRLECYRPANPQNWPAIVRQRLRRVLGRG